jgi:hypothetical protein
MYGTLTGTTVGIGAGIFFLIIALAVFASPLIAVVLFVIAAIGLLIAMSVVRRRSRGTETIESGAPGRSPAGPRAPTTSGPRPSGAPASGEGEIS